MSKQPKPLVTGLLHQNCFIRDCAPLVDLHTSCEQQYYETMDEVTDAESNTLRHEKHIVPYEITPEYVQGFAESADYRRDPVAAIVNAPKRQGLGDIRDFQAVASMDDEQAQALYAQLQERFSAAQKEVLKEVKEAPVEVSETPQSE